MEWYFLSENFGMHFAFMAQNDVNRFESKSIETFDSLPGSYHVDSSYGSLPV